MSPLLKNKPLIISAWGAGGAGGNVDGRGDDEDAGPGGNGAFLEFKIEGLIGNETIYAYPGGGGSPFTQANIVITGTDVYGGAGGGGAATLVYITNGENTDYLAVVGAGGGGGGVGHDPDDYDASAGGEGGIEGGNGARSQDTGGGGEGGGGGTQSTGGTGRYNALDAPAKGTYAGNGGIGGKTGSGWTTGNTGGIVGHSFGGAGAGGGSSIGNRYSNGGGGGGGGGWYGGAGGSEGNTASHRNGRAGAGGGGGSTKLNTSPSGFSYLTITKIASAAGTNSPNVQHDGAASTQTAGSTNHFSVDIGGQAGRGGQVNAQGGLGGSNGRVAIGFMNESTLLNSTSTSGGTVVI